MLKTIPKGIVLDEDGFLASPHLSSPEVVDFLATEQDLGTLSEEHWRVIEHLRDYYLEFSIPPPVPMLCKETRLTMKDIRNLFPNGLRDGAVKIAGLPKPSGLYP